MAVPSASQRAPSEPPQVRSVPPAVRHRSPELERRPSPPIDKPRPAISRDESAQTTPKPTQAQARPAAAAAVAVPAAAPAKTQEPAQDEPEPIDMETFRQILDLDEDGAYDFSVAMAWAYFAQAGTTFSDMDQAYEDKSLLRLSELGHFLKGSSAALGVHKVQASCERIQHYGQLRDEEKDANLTAEEALEKIAPLLSKIKVDFNVAERWLKDWYLKAGVEGPEEDP